MATKTKSKPTPTITESALSLPVSPPAPNATAELERLAAERIDIETLAEVDTSRRASDPAQWRERANARNDRIDEIERETRRLTDWRDLALTHPAAIQTYEATSRSVQARNKYLIENFTWIDKGTASRQTGSTSRDVEAWFDAMTILAQSFDLTDEQARQAMTRELNAWNRLRAAYCCVVTSDSATGGVPWPEFAASLGRLDQLPPWLTICATRGDR